VCLMGKSAVFYHLCLSAWHAEAGEGGC